MFRLPPDFRVPGFVSIALRPLPLRPLELFLQQLADSIAERYPGIIERIGYARPLRFGIEPSDVPFAVRIELGEAGVRLQVMRHLDDVDARISGTLAALVALVDGDCDGDALFFSRGIIVEGDIAAVLALRNAIDDAEIKLLREAAEMVASWVSRAEMQLRYLVGDGHRGARTGTSRP
jgi:O2-independent ubiquinone biosynthesis accessory factor UbiT